MFLLCSNACLFTDALLLKLDYIQQDPRLNNNNNNNNNNNSNNNNGFNAYTGRQTPTKQQEDTLANRRQRNLVDLIQQVKTQTKQLSPIAIDYQHYK